MRKINGQPVDAITDISDTSGGEVLKWDNANTQMVWEYPSGSSYDSPSPNWVGDRGVFFGGNGSYGNRIGYTSISAKSDVTDAANLQSYKNHTEAVSNSSRGVCCAGYWDNVNSSPQGTVNEMDYITIASISNASDFGDMLDDQIHQGAGSNDTRGLIAGGQESAAGNHDTIEYITIATTGNGTDFGNLSTAKYNLMSVNSTTRCLFAGGTTDLNVIEYVAFDTTGNSADFGDLSEGREGGGGVCDNFRGVFGGDNGTMDYVAMATLGNATDFGDIGYGAASACEDGTTGVFARDGSGDMAYITIQTTGNAADFADMDVPRSGTSACSGD